jgi:hypothetical protein
MKQSHFYRLLLCVVFQAWHYNLLSTELLDRVGPLFATWLWKFELCLKWLLGFLLNSILISICFCTLIQLDLKSSPAFAKAITLCLSTFYFYSLSKIIRHDWLIYSSFRWKFWDFDGSDVASLGEFRWNIMLFRACFEDNLFLGSLSNSLIVKDLTSFEIFAQMEGGYWI